MSTFNGTLINVDDTQFVSAKFKKREFVVGTNDKYPQYVTFVAIQEKCEMLDFAKPGDQIQVGYKLAGRKWESPSGQIKYFNTIEAWRIEKQGQSQGMGMPSAGPSAMSLDTDPLPGASAASSEDDDDLPF